MKKLIIIALLFASFFSEAQSFVEEHYQYDRIFKRMQGYYNRGMYHKATEYPDSLKGNKFVDGYTEYFMARVYALGNEFDKTLFHLEKAIKQGISKKEIEQMYDLDGFRESNMNIIYEINYGKWYQEYEDNKNDLELDSNYIKQLNEISDSYKSVNVREVDGDLIFEVQDSVNEIYDYDELKTFNFNTTVRLILENGFPTKKRVGDNFNIMSYRFWYNMPDGFIESSDWEKIKKMIFEEIKKGNLKPPYYAFVEDKIRHRKNRPQLYGTIRYHYFNNTDLTNTMEYETPEELNIRRKSVGLCAIELELWSKAQELPLPLKDIKFK